MELNEFYSITKLNQKPENSYQIENLGEETWYGTSVDFNGNSNSLYLPTTKKDYDNHFVYMITSFEPPYDICKLLNYHLDYYINKTQDKSTFLKHIRYVILPQVKKSIKSKVKREVYVELIIEWLESKENKIPVLNSLQVKGNNNIILQNVKNSALDI